jgi:hypothetical protein
MSGWRNFAGARSTVLLGGAAGKKTFSAKGGNLVESGKLFHVEQFGCSVPQIKMFHVEHFQKQQRRGGKIKLFHVEQFGSAARCVPVAPLSSSLREKIGKNYA